MKKARRRILIIGNFCTDVEEPPNGQTQKTRELADLLKSDEQFLIDTWDTENIRKKKYFRLLSLFWKFLVNNDYIILPAQKSIHFVPKIALQFARIKHAKVVYVVIGGWMPDYIRTQPKLREVLKKLSIILVEAEAMKQNCNEQGVHNVEVLPNFKIIEPLATRPKTYQKGDKLKAVFISRIMEQKGVFILLNALSRLYEKYGDRIEVDFFGPYKDSKERFEEEIKKVPNAHYKGVLKPEDVQQVLLNYDFFIFPTYYRGEGFSGVFLDAIFSNTPIAASNWKYNAEIVEHQQTGLLFEANSPDSLGKTLEALIENPQQLSTLKKNMLVLQDKYYYKNVGKTLHTYLK